MHCSVKLVIVSGAFEVADDLMVAKDPVVIAVHPVEHLPKTPFLLSSCNSNGHLALSSCRAGWAGYKQLVR
ncbi:unnamed protein product [Protopolystoma xenopodis]|uniref:Uncharacterized protein n=1 Tax=Protopolystoma xenopodis TaxID=117903 RepID=A0A448X2E1_9PLAT|nr:unnamed protein product [Protopolystoma xenopodis]